MRGRSLVTIGVFAALIFICVLFGLIAYGLFSWFGDQAGGVRLFDTAVASEEVAESRKFSPKENLEIQSDSGDIVVQAADVSEIEVEMVKQVWAGSQEEAQAQAEALQVSVDESESTLKLIYEDPERFNLFTMGFRNDKIDFIVRVPAEINVDLQTSYGEIELTGVTGDANLQGGFGAITVSDVRGALTANSANADIVVKQVQAEPGAIQVKTSFGNIVAEDLNGTVIELETSNGDITGNNLVAAGALEVGTQFGQLSLSQVTAETLTAKNANGDVTVDGGLVTGAVRVSNSFGPVEVLGVEAASMDLSLSNGSILVDGGGALLALETSFGGIEVRDATDAILDLRSSNGQIEFRGSLDPEADHRVETSFGSIGLVLPPDSAFNLILETSFGTIESDIPLTSTDLAQNASAGDSRWEAAIGGGGPLLQLKTSNGDITISSLGEE